MGPRGDCTIHRGGLSAVGEQVVRSKVADGEGRMSTGDGVSMRYRDMSLLHWLGMRQWYRRRSIGQSLVMIVILGRC